MGEDQVSQWMTWSYSVDMMTAIKGVSYLVVFWLGRQSVWRRVRKAVRSGASLGRV